MTKVWNSKNIELHCGADKYDKMYYRLRIFEKQDDGSYKDCSGFVTMAKLKELVKVAGEQVLE